MNQLIEDAIKKLHRLDALMTALEPIMSDKSPTVFTDGSLGYSEPYAPQVIHYRGQQLTEMGFVLQSQKTFTHDGTLAMTWVKDECQVIVYFWPAQEGSVCKLVKIGEETKVVPIYEVTCLNAEGG